LGRHHPRAAITELQTVSPYDLSAFSAGASIYYRGLAYLEPHSGKEAVIEFQNIVDNRGAAWFYWPLAHLGLARAYAQTGDVEKSLAPYREFLAHWKNADRDLLIFEQAEKEMPHLANRPRIKRSRSNPPQLSPKTISLFRSSRYPGAPGSTRRRQVH
jgi:tetratricopeptide (TPR) repeat protein